MIRGRGQNRGRRGRGRRQTSSSIRGTAALPNTAPTNQGPSSLVRQPTLHPRVAFARMVDRTYDFSNDGINPTLIGYDFNLTILPQYLEWTAMFQAYCIESIEIWIRPEYTVLSDSAPLSNAVNVEMFTCIDLTNNTAPTSLGDVQAYQSCAHTGITQNHYRKFAPAYSTNSIPVCGLVSTTNPGAKWNGLKIAVPPCGVAMTFRTVVKMKVAFYGLK